MSEPEFEVRLAESAADLRAAQRLRYRVFVEELGGGGEMVDHAARLERDRFDAHSDHMILWDGDQAVGVYRLMREAHARAAGGFYTEAEYDLGPLLTSGRRLLELGRSCLLPEYRGGAGMYHLWTGLAGYVEARGIEVLFGVASFHGTDVEALKAPLSLLAQRHMAPAAMRVRARKYQEMNLVPEADLDRRAAMLAVPALIKAYLRLGGTVGEGAFVDHAFNTVDVFLMMDTGKMNADRARLYAQAGRG